MLIRSTPIDRGKYLAVHDKDADKLHQAGFKPKYMDNNLMYFLWTKDLLATYESIIGGDNFAKNS